MKETYDEAEQARPFLFSLREKIVALRARLRQEKKIR